MKFKKSDNIIKIMSIILILLTARLVAISSRSGVDASLTVNGQGVGSIPDYVSLFPNLYAEPLNGYIYPDGEQKVAFLTFDDGPSIYTFNVLDILKEEGVKATFFVIGNNMSEERIECLKRIIDEGHTLGLHTYSHEYNEIYNSVETFLKDYDKLNQFLYDELGIKTNIYRFPGGSYTTYNKHIRNDLIDEMSRRGYVYYDWNVSAEDSVGNPTAYSIMKNINKDVFRFSTPVILMHDSEANALTAKLLPEIIYEIKEKGYTFDTLDKRLPVHF